MNVSADGSRGLPWKFLRILKRIWTTRLGLRKRRPYSLGYEYQPPLMPHLPAGGVILDIACGGNPLPQATLLSDLHMGPSPHRTVPLARDQRPFIVLDIHHLPFKDKSIDYVYCSHVLEHVADPELACREIMRVAKAGYIETPTLMKDALFAWAGMIHHRWHVTRIGTRLVFFEYDERRRQGVRTTQWRDAVLGEFHHPDQDLFFPNQDLFNTCLEWKTGFEVTVFRLPPASS